MSWHTYLLRCSDDTLYVGVTTDLARRLHEHNATARGARYTRSRRPVVLLATWESPTRTEAQRMEWRVRRLPRDKKLALVEGAPAEGASSGQ